MQISASLVKELREKTGAGFIDCKKALEKNNKEIDKAILYLKESGIIKAANKSGRLTKEGLISIVTNDNLNECMIAEINCETDFVAKNEIFKKKSYNIIKKLFLSQTESIDNIPSDIDNELKSLISHLGENMTIRRFKRIKVSNNGFLSYYIHQGGFIGVVLELLCEKKETSFQKSFKRLAKDICLHIAAMSPLFLSKEKCSENFLKDQEKIFLKQAKESGKSNNIIQNIVKGKIKQYLKEIVLLEQSFIKEDKYLVQQWIDLEAKKLNDQIKIKQFVRFKVGE